MRNAFDNKNNDEEYSPTPNFQDDLYNLNITNLKRMKIKRESNAMQLNLNSQTKLLGKKSLANELFLFYGTVLHYLKGKSIDLTSPLLPCESFL